MALTNISNIVSEGKLRQIQLDTLDELSAALVNSFGPNGSTTCIKKENAFNIYTKDGYNILKNILFNGIIEQSIKDDIESITRYIVTTVGDGTTSAVLLSDTIFEELYNSDKLKRYLPSTILESVNDVVADIKKTILKNSKECTVQDIYDIAMISSNGNEEISTNLKKIYEEFGMNVFIDVNISNGVESKLKIYDGLTLNTGFDSNSFINSPNNTCIIRNPHIYFFEDPIDTPEMATFMDIIISNNILYPLNDKSNKMDVVPTVIFAPHVSRDISATLGYIIDQLTNLKSASKPPLLIVTGFNDMETYLDIMQLCGGKPIRKYIDPKIQEADIKNGNAPDDKTIVNWFGTADEVSSDPTNTKIINPVHIKDEIYNNIIATVEGELTVAQANGENAGVTGRIKRRLNSLKGNMVEYLVGGITVADRDSVRDLVEDAVKNTRSAAINGVGYAANFEAYNAIKQILGMGGDMKEIDYFVLNILKNAYRKLIELLYTKSIGNGADGFIETIDSGIPVNLRNMDRSGKSVKSSIESDMIILDSVAKIIGIMFTTNQFVVPTPAHNVYMEF